MQHNEMELPQYYELVRTVAQIGAVLGGLAGLTTLLGGLGAFQYGLFAGITAIFGGIVTIVLSLVGLGVTYCFLAIVKAQIDARNAIFKYITAKGLD